MKTKYFRTASVQEKPTKDGKYFIAYKDNKEIIFSDSEWTKEKGWETGAKDLMIYWLEEILAKNFLQPDVIKSVCLHEWDEGSHNVHKCTKCGKYNC